MAGIGSWWVMATGQERLAAFVVPAILVFTLGTMWVVNQRGGASISCEEAEDAKAAVVEAMRDIERASREDKCHAYGLMADLLRRYQGDWRRCAPGGYAGRNGPGNLQIEINFYANLSTKCG